MSKHGFDDQAALDVGHGDRPQPRGEARGAAAEVGCDADAQRNAGPQRERRPGRAAVAAEHDVEVATAQAGRQPQLGR